MDALIHDLRYAVRTLRQSPLFLIVAAVTLAFGIGVNVTIFSFVNTLLLRPLAVDEPDELVEVYTEVPTEETFYSTSSYPDYVDLRDQNEVFSGLVGHSKMIAQLVVHGRNEFVIGELATGNYFEVLGVPAALGRTLRPSDDGAPVAVLGHGLWQRRFGGDPGALGSTLRLNGIAYTVIGVAPQSFIGTVPGLASELWIPATRVADVEPAGSIDVVASPRGDTRLEQRGNRWMFLKGRLAPGVTLEQAEAQLGTLMAALARKHPETNEDRGIALVPTRQVRFHPLLDQALRPAAAVLMGVVGLVLLIACANLANMVLSRSATRRREIAVRLALGASRLQLVRQLLAESLLISLLGSGMALLLAGWTTQLLLAHQPPLAFSLSLDLGVDGRVVAFALALSLVSAPAFGLLPALKASRRELAPALKEGFRGEAEGGRRFGLRQGLVVVQVAVSLVLLIGAALLGRSFAAARTLDPGFEPDRIAVLWMHLGMHGYDGERAADFYRELLGRVRVLPGVEAASLASRMPFSLNVSNTSLYVEGRRLSADDPAFNVASAAVAPDYFAAMGIPFVHGRDFGDADAPGKPRVAIVNEAMARRFWTPGRAVGERFRLDSRDGAPVEIVGVVRDHKVNSLGEEPTPQVFFARRQVSHPAANLVVRADGDAAALLGPLRRAALELEPELAFGNVGTMTDRMAVALYPVRMGALLVGVFGALALLLASVGLYGVIAYSVSRRDREIGLRMALGARPADVWRLVVRQGMALVGVGVVGGVLLAAAGTRALAGMLYGVSAVDPIAFGVGVGVLVLVALVANYVPASRASRLDPLVALREE